MRAEQLVPLRVSAHPLDPGQDWAEALQARRADETAWERELPPVIRLYDSDGASLDLRTGLLCPQPLPKQILRTNLLAQLPWPDLA